MSYLVVVECVIWSGGEARRGRGERAEDGVNTGGCYIALDVCMPPFPCQLCEPSIIPVHSSHVVL